jgi:hypothetical protein
MATDVPPTLREYILGAHEITVTERALAAMLEQSGHSADQLADALVTDKLDPLSAAYVRWEEHVRGLESPRYTLPLDGYSLMVVSVSREDLPILLTALKNRVFDIEEDAADGIDYDQRVLETLYNIIWRFEGRLW